MGYDLQGLARPRKGFSTMLGALDTWASPGRSDVPTLVGWGSRDLQLPRAQIRRLRREPPDARVVVMPGCGHVPMADDPGLTAELILSNARLAPGGAGRNSNLNDCSCERLARALGGGPA